MSESKRRNLSCKNASPLALPTHRSLRTLGDRPHSSPPSLVWARIRSFQCGGWRRRRPNSLQAPNGRPTGGSSQVTGVFWGKWAPWTLKQTVGGSPSRNLLGVRPVAAQAGGCAPRLTLALNLCGTFLEGFFKATRLLSQSIRWSQKETLWGSGRLLGWAARVGPDFGRCWVKGRRKDFGWMRACMD